MRALNGTTPGNETLKEIVKKNPELQRVIVGKEFAANPGKLLESSELLEPYVGMNGQISKIIKEQKQIKDIASNKIPKLEEAVKRANNRKHFRRGATTAGAGILGGLALETALGRDWKEDLPLLAHLKTLKGSMPKK